MGNFWREFNRFLSRWLTPAVRLLFIVTVVVFLLQLLLVPLFTKQFGPVFFALMQTPSEILTRFFVWQFVTYMFMHAGVWHLLFNMLILWFFGPRLEYRWGSARFLRFYLIVGVGAGLFHFIVALLTKHPDASLLGASGALYGIMLAYALYWPDDIVLLYFVIPVKIKYLMIFGAIFTFLASASGPATGGISHITHLGGLIVALFYLKGGDWWRNWRSRGRRGRSRPRVIRVDPSRHPDFR